MRRLAVRLCVILTALLCLAVVGYVWQTWWARRVASDLVFNANIPGIWDDIDWSQSIKRWKREPWYGRWNASALYFDTARMNAAGGLVRGITGPPRSAPYSGFVWHPRSVYYEFLRLATAQDLPNDPDVWETWFKAHPNLSWDVRQKRFVESTTP